MPSCRRCLDHGLQCPGYTRKLDFVFYDSGASKKNAIIPVRAQNIQHIQSRRPSKNQVTITNGCELSHSLAIPQNKTGLLAVIQERYVPQLPKFPTEKGSVNGANWISTACSLATNTQYGMLSDSLLAISLSLVSLEQQRRQLSTASLKQYSSALQGLRSSLTHDSLDLSQDQIDVSLVTCLACGMYEVSRFPWTVFNTHRC